MVEHTTENRGVPSPILGLGTLDRTIRKVEICGRSTVVVRLLAKEKVVGSNPIARSNIEGCGWNMFSRNPHCIWRRGQVVRQGSAKSSSGVQIPSTPLQKQTGLGLLFCLSIIMKKG